MIRRTVLLCLLGLMLTIHAVAAMQGGYTPASIIDKEIIAAAEFAVRAQEEAIQKQKSPDLTTLKLVKILSAHQQIVAGINYLLTLKLTLNGESRQAETVVWWQAWRKPNPYELTSWKWKKNEGQNELDADDR